MKRNTVEVYRGPSMIDGAPIVVLVTGLKGSSNSKTGSMVQSYILRADIDPMQALKTGQDRSICGGCVHRPKSYDGQSYSGRSCYVNVGQGALSVWRSWNRGNVATVTLQQLAALVAGRPVRLGTYGDPAAVPVHVWDAYVSTSSLHTGYTHQAGSKKFWGVLKYCQVSADLEGDAIAAKSAGIGSFRVLAQGESPLPFESLCPALSGVQCADCGACSGVTGSNIAIPAHGIGARLVKSPRRRPYSLPVIAGVDPLTVGGYYDNKAATQASPIHS
jgi:hypothetical protein